MSEAQLRTCFFTGHRNISTKHLPELTSRLDSVITSLIAEGFDCFVCGGAVGFDTLAACRVAVAKKYFQNISLALVLPCRDQTSRWKRPYDIALYQRLKGLADSVTYASDIYTAQCMHTRNRMMADMSSVCIAYYSGRGGGTAYTVRYATTQGLRIINLYEKTKNSN